MRSCIVVLQYGIVSYLLKLRYDQRLQYLIPIPKGVDISSHMEGMDHFQVETKFKICLPLAVPLKF